MGYVRSGTENTIRKATYQNGGGKSAGKDDIWVAQLNTNDGALKWMKQLGSTGDDHVSRTNGVQADVVGDCIIYGDVRDVTTCSYSSVLWSLFILSLSSSWSYNYNCDCN